MKHIGYYTRAMNTADRRFIRVFEKMGYSPKDAEDGAEIRRDEEVETKVSPRSRKAKNQE